MAIWGNDPARKEKIGGISGLECNVLFCFVCLFFHQRVLPVLAADGAAAALHDGQHADAQLARQSRRPQLSDGAGARHAAAGPDGHHAPDRTAGYFFFACLFRQNA